LSLPLGLYHGVDEGRVAAPFPDLHHCGVHDLRPGRLPESKLDEDGGRPGDSLRFAAVTVETADALCRDAERRLTEMVAWLEPVPARQRSTSGRFMTAI
jgi:hypothetical protein